MPTSAVSPCAGLGSQAQQGALAFACSLWAGRKGRGVLLSLARSLDGEKDHMGASSSAFLEPSRHQNVPRGREDGLEGCWTPNCFSALLILPRAGKDVQVC